MFCFLSISKRLEMQSDFLLLTLDLGGISRSEQLSMVTVETKTQLAVHGHPLDGHSIVSSLKQGDKNALFYILYTKNVCFSKTIFRIHMMNFFINIYSVISISLKGLAIFFLLLHNQLQKVFDPFNKSMLLFLKMLLKKLEFLFSFFFV